MPIYVPPAPEPAGGLSTFALIQAAVITAQENIQVVRPDVPGDGSPGYLALLYNDSASARHQCRFHLTTVANPYDYGQMLGEANRLAPGLASVIPSALAVNGFAVYNAEAIEIFAGLLSSTHTGFHVSEGSCDAWSYSISLTGRGLSAGPGLIPGNALTRWFPEIGWNDDRGRKFLSLGASLGLVQFAGLLGTSTIAWADAHGWKAGIRPTCPIQHNAAVQRKRGN